ncbi:MAG: RagB/SusD family nutrient uptake outer membrane protein, partial [Selenomonas sp.]|nr:RagB/SusD family nutrient uptake outer membrane protein [Selenomonas sp.]
MKLEQHNVQQRVAFLAAIMLGCVILLIFRYGWLQLVQGNSLGERMKAQVGQDYAIQSPRGAILDRNGRELAVSTMTKSLYIDPSHVENPQEVAANLAPLIGKSEQDILDDIAVGGGFVWVKRRMEQAEYEAVRQLIREKNYVSCLNFRDEAKRYYPNDVLAANVIGFVGTDDKGLDGVEQALDKMLKGEVKETYLTTDRQDRPILDSIFSSRRRYAGDACKTIELTIDSSIQFIVEQELDRAIAENNPKAVTCVVMDPKTGEVLAMASRPSYNPNRFWDYNPEIWKNRAVLINVTYTRDPRLYEECIVNGMQKHLDWTTAATSGDIWELWAGGTDGLKGVTAQTDMFGTGYGYNKYYMGDGTTGSGDNQRYQTQWVYLSLNEMYLMYAEALLKKSAPDIQKACEMVDVVRARVGLGGLKQRVFGNKAYSDPVYTEVTNAGKIFEST